MLTPREKYDQTVQAFVDTGKVWFTRDEARRALEGTNPDLVVPDRVAIAHHLIRAWVDGVLAGRSLDRLRDVVLRALDGGLAGLGGS